jgi:prolyl-tRNA editing enzyme YbaK/EbsC (Cys-tRNA(Pro) deacylase)
MPSNLSSSARKVQKALAACGLTCEVLEMPQTTRTAEEAARAVGCGVGQIVKSLVFQGKQTRLPILVAASGVNRVNEKKLARLVSEPILKADAGFVRETTGFAIGGVPPLGHAKRMRIFIDEDLFQYGEIWAAAGNPRAVFKLTPDELLKITRGQVVSVK